MNGVLSALLLTLIAGAATGIGGALVLFMKKLSSNVLAGALGLSAGVMIFISLAELFPEAQAEITALGSIRHGEAFVLLAFFAGMGIITLIDFLIPEYENPHEASGLSLDAKTAAVGVLEQTGNEKALHRLGLMSALAIAIHNFPEGIATFIGALNDPQMGGGITFAIAIHAIYSVSEEMILWGTDFARRNGLKIHIHLSETSKEVEDCMAEHGVSPVVYLDRLGVLGPDVIAAHTLWLSEEDAEILGKRGVTCVHNVNSNLKLASGYRFPYAELRDAGANICLGTDGCASSNNLDMLETMKTAAMIQKAWRNDPSAMPIPELISMATSNAGKALGLEIGKIEPGALADILIVDTENYNFLSPAPFEANLIYSAHSDCIDSVICNGRFVMRNRKVEGEKEILRNAAEMLTKLM